MKAFSVLFQERNSPIIIYNGKNVYRYLRCTEKGKYILKFRNIKTRAKRMQFFMVHLLKMDGEIYVNDKPFLVPKCFPEFHLALSAPLLDKYPLNLYVPYTVSDVWQ